MAVGLPMFSLLLVTGAIQWNRITHLHDEREYLDAVSRLAE